SYSWGATATYFRSASCNGSGTPKRNDSSFGNVETFCAGNGSTPVGGGCVGGKICVAHQPNHCILKFGASQSCPTNYPARSTTYYRGKTDDVTCACGCLGSGGSCGNAVALGQGGCTTPINAQGTCTLASDATWSGYDRVIVPPPSSYGSCSVAFPQQYGDSN